MPSATGQVKVTRTRIPGTPPTFTLTVKLVGRIGEGDTTFDPVPDEWVDFFEKMADKRVTATFTLNPLVISQVAQV